MAPAAIQDVFNIKRLPGGHHFLLFLIYFPLGTFICLLRLLFCVQIGLFLLLLPKDSLIRRIILRIHGIVLGIIIFVEGHQPPPGLKILVCNSISQLDSLILESIDSLVLVSRTQQLPSFLHWLMGYPDFASCSSSQIPSKFTSYCSSAERESSVLVFPEETTSSGNVGILKFSTWSFDTSLAYQPIVLKAKRFSLLPIKLSVVDGSFWSDFIWSLFVPYTIFHVRYLPEMHKEEAALVEDFAKSVQKKMAESLGVHPSQFDFNDKKEFVKRIKHESEERFSPSVKKVVPQLQQRPPSTSKSDRMVQQVKDVLPQVPISVIRKDILKSKSVDATLANILEGNVPYTPLTSEEIQAEKRKQLEKRSESANRQVNPAQNLPDNAKSLSYQEKKKLMIDEARRRYLEKHPEYLE